MMRRVANVCLVTVLLLFHRQLVCSATGCAQWSAYQNQLSTGALLKHEYTSLRACQNYCVQNDKCVAVDFVSSRSECWEHTNVDSLSQNTRTGVPGVTQYRLNRTCGVQMTTPTRTRVCRPTWRIMDDTNARGAKESDSFRVPDVEACLNECLRVSNCVAVDVNVGDEPHVCWPHHRAADLKDDNIFSQQGTNLYQLTGSCAPNCVPQWIRMNDTNAHGVADFFNVTSETECLDHCMQDLRCVAVDVNHDENPLRCWPHYEQNDIFNENLYSQPGTSLFIPVKRCIASLYWATTTSASAGIKRAISATATTTTTTILLLMLLFALLINNRHDVCL